MNNKNMSFAISLIIASFALSAISGLVTVQAEQSNFMPYGSIGQEDQLYVIDNNDNIWLNVVLGQGNGQFMKITDLQTEYTVDQAIERFGIYEDSFSFVVEPSVYSTIGLVFQFNEETTTFQLLGAIEV